MLYCTGDIHANVSWLLNRLDRVGVPNSPEQIIVLLGDVGVNYFRGDSDTRRKQALQQSGRTYFCIHGNHEIRPEMIPSYRTQLWNGGEVYVEDAFPHILFAKDGEVYDLEGRTALVLGGAYSVDKLYRVAMNLGWWEDEQISPERRDEIMEQIKQLGPIDFVFSHTCPYEWQPTELFLSSIDQSAVDNTMERWLSDVEQRLIYKHWLFGHFHGDKQINARARMLFGQIIDLETMQTVYGGTGESAGLD
jgi:3-oxoacid CoA-transferase subunit A